MNEEKLKKNLKDKVEELEFENDNLSSECEDWYKKFEEEANLRRIISKKEIELSEYCNTLEKILEKNNIDINNEIEKLENQEFEKEKK